MIATRNLNIVLSFDEEEARELYLSINPPYLMDSTDEIKEKIVECLGYTPKQAPSL